MTFERRKQIHVHLRFRGGATESFSLEAPKKAWQLRKTPDKIVNRIDRLLDDHGEWQVAKILDEDGLVTATNHRFTGRIVNYICRKYQLIPRRQRLVERGLLSASEIAKKFHVAQCKVMAWNRAGLLKRHRYSRDWWLYEDPTPIAGQLPGLPEDVKRQLSL